MKFVRDSRLADSASRGLTPRFLLLVTGLALSALAAVALAASITPARAAGEVTIEFQTSSDHAARHPDLRVTIENNSAGDITSATMSLPVGFVGSLNATIDGPDGDTEGDRCPWIDDAADFAANCEGALADRAKVGTVKNIAHLDNAANDNTTILNGSVYMTDRNPAQTGDAAGMVIVVDAKVSNLDLGRVVVPARLKLRPWLDEEAPAPAYENVFSPEGVDTIVENIPTSITDPDHGTINFTIDKIVMDIMGDPPGGASPLITTPSDCATGPLDVSASFTTTDPGAPTVNATDTHTPDNCDKVAFEPAVTTFSVSDNGATDLISDINIGIAFPAGSSTVRSAIVDLPRELVVNTPGAAGNCLQTFTMSADPLANCSDVANLGTATVTSPLLSYPIVGEVLSEDSGGTLPNIYMVFRDPDIGLDARIRGSASVLKTGATQVAAGDFVRTTLNLNSDGSSADLPSLPLSSMVINLHREDPGTQLPDTSLSAGPILAVGTGYACNSTASARFILNSWSGATRQLVSPPVNFDCAANGQTVASAINILSGPANGETVTTDSATFVIQNDHSATVRMRTSVDDGTNALAGLPFDSNLEAYASTPSTAVGANREVTLSGLTDGTVYKFLVQAAPTSTTQVDQERRVFKVDLPGEGPEAADTTAPTVQIDGGPADPTPTSDTTPTFNFSGTDNTTVAADIKYQCSLDGKAFQPCGSGASGSYTPSAPLAIPTSEWDPAHSFAVRSEDKWGNVSTASSVDFTIDIPFAPTVSVTPTTVAARSHPTMEVVVNNNATDDIKTFDFSMPKGFLGSLLGAPAQCTVTQADAAACPAGSQIGVIEATAQIDESEATLDGKIYLTEPWQAGDPAGLVVHIQDKVGDLDLENTEIYKVRLKVRGQAEGVDAVSDPLPRTVHDTVKNVDLTFRAKYLKMTLTGNNAGTQPFLWAASDCSPGQQYVADFGSYDLDDSQTVVPFTTTGCDALPFEPKLSMNIAEAGGVGAPTAGENFTAVATMLGSPTDSGIKSAEVTLPPTVTLDASQVPANICEAAQITAHTCPPESLAGTATVNTPLLATPLTGPVYMARNPGKAVPNLSVQLSGLISIDLFASSKFVGPDFTQINTTFNSVPDAPMTSFTMSIDKMLIMQSTACDVPIEERGIKGVATAFNGKTVSLDTPPLAMDCKDDISVSSTFKNKSKKSTLSMTVTANGLHAKTKKAQLKLPKGLTMVKKALKKKLLVTGDGRRLKTNCWKFKNSRTLDLSLCKKQYDEIKLSFKAGSLTATKKVKGSSKATLKITPATGKVETLKPPLSTKRYPAA